jgi:hypothetical protein
VVPLVQGIILAPPTASNSILAADHATLGNLHFAGLGS